MTLIVLVLLVQIVIPFFLIKAMVDQNHAFDDDEVLSFCPKDHHTPTNRISCWVLMTFLIGTVLTSAPRSRLLCLQFETYECTRKHTKYGRFWLQLGFCVTTIMQVICTGATYVLFIEYENLPDLLLNAVALVFVLEADTLMSKIYLAGHLTDAAEVHDAKKHWFEHARGTIVYARYGILAGRSTLHEMKFLMKGMLGVWLSTYMVIYLGNVAWQLSVLTLMVVCY